MATNPDKAAPAGPVTTAAGTAVEDVPLRALAVYVLLGALFGIVLVKAEVVSWFRIQEMFRFQGFHMYGVIGSALVVATPSVWLIKKRKVKTLAGEEITIPGKQWETGTRYWLGGTIFGSGWGLIGACPGPLFALLGAGVGPIIFSILSALAGTWVYGVLRPRLPH